MKKAETIEEFLEQLQFCPVDGRSLRNSAPAGRYCPTCGAEFRLTTWRNDEGGGEFFLTLLPVL